MTTILAKLEHSSTIPTEAQVESLALERYNNAGLIARVDGAYLRILLIASQAQLGKSRSRKVDPKAQAAVLVKVSDQFYSAVLRGVTTHDIAIEADLEQKEATRRSLERNRRSAFARSAKSTLLAYATAGGDLRTLDPNTVTKTGLRKALSPPEPTNKTERQILRSKGSLYRAVARQARLDVDEARGTCEAAIEELQAMLDQLPAENAAPTPPPAPKVERRAPAPRHDGHTRTRIIPPVLNSQPAA